MSQKHSWGVDGRVKRPYRARTYQNVANMKTNILKGSRPNQKEELQDEIRPSIIEKMKRWANEKKIEDVDREMKHSIKEKDTTVELGKTGVENGCATDAHTGGMK